MKLKRNIVKICSLALGLAIGTILIAKVCFELSYDNFYSDKERVYSIMTGAVCSRCGVGYKGYPCI